MHKHYRRMMSDSLDESPQQDSAHLFMAYDGDNAGRLVGQAILADDPKGLHEASSKIEHGHDIVHDWVESHGGQIISGGGDEGTFAIPGHAIHDIEHLRKDYQYATGLTMTVGVGTSLSEAGKALMVGKFRGKDQVCHYDQSIEQELEQAKAHVASGSATPEEQKLGEAYLKPKDDNMNESENTHDDCQYCAELNEANSQDLDHCQYCHDIHQESEPHCQYCAEAEQKQAQDHDHSGDNCQYCAEAEAKTQGHEHSGDDCQYCAEANASPSHEHTGDDCAYCASAPSQSAEGPGDMPGTQMQDNVSHPNSFQQNVPGDMGMAEAAPAQGPDLTSVLQTGLDQHADNIQKERVIQIVAEALEGFKQCKDILERAKEQAPQLYTSSISMLRAMIEMGKMLGLTAKEQAPQAPAQAAPQPATAPAQAPMGEQPGGK